MKITLEIANGSKFAEAVMIGSAPTEPEAPPLERYAGGCEGMKFCLQSYPSQRQTATGHNLPYGHPYVEPFPNFSSACNWIQSQKPIEKGQRCVSICSMAFYLWKTFSLTVPQIDVCLWPYNLSFMDPIDRPEFLWAIKRGAR